jgi:hypothetical protein
MEASRGQPLVEGRIRLVVLRVLAALAGLFFLVAVVLAVPAPWVLLQPEDPNAAENRWFLTVAGSVDAIAVVMFFALVQRPRRTLLFVEMSAAVVIAAAMILPFDLLFAAILVVASVPLVVYPYWRDARAFPFGGRGAPAATDLGRARRSRAAGDGDHRAAPRDRWNRPGGSGELMAGLCGACHDIGRQRGARRQPRTRLAHSQVHLRCGAALPGVCRHAGPSSPHRIVGLHRRYRRNPCRVRFRTGRMARSGATKTAIWTTVNPGLIPGNQFNCSGAEG